MTEARSAFRLQDFVKVHELCSEVLRQQPGHRGALELRGRACMRMNDYDGAIESWYLLDDGNAGDLEKRTRFIATLLNLRQYDEAKKVVLETLEKWPNESRAYCQLIRLHHEQREWKEIPAIWHSICQLDPDVLNALKAKSYFVEVCGRVAESFLHLNMLSETLAIQMEIQQGIDGHRVALEIERQIYTFKKDHDQARRIDIELCNRYPRRIKYWRQSVQLLTTMGKSEAARANLYRASSVFSDDAISTGNLALLAESVMLPEAEKALLGKALKLAPDRTNLLVQLIDGYWNLDRMDRVHFLSDRLKKLCPYTFRNSPTIEKLEKLLKLANAEQSMSSVSQSSGEKFFKTQLVTDAIFQRIAVGAMDNIQSVTRVAMVTHSLRRGGAERQLVTCLDSLASDPQRSFELVLYTGCHDNKSPEHTYHVDLLDLPIEFVEFDGRCSWDIMDHPESGLIAPWSEILNFLPDKMMKQVAHLVYEFHRQKPEVVHAWGDELNIVASLAALMSGVPRILLSARTTAPQKREEVRRFRPHSLRADVWRATYQRLLSSPRVRLCHNSQAGADTYRDWLSDPGLDTPILYNGVNFDGLEKQSQQATAREPVDILRLLDNSIVVGTVMRFERVKQPFLWLEAARIIHSELPDCKFIMVGAGSLLDSCEQKVEEMGMSDVFVFPGATHKVKLWLDKMDLFLMTSVIEGLPNALIEAQGFGVPAVSTNAGGTTEVIIDGVTGKIADGNANSIAESVISCLKDQSWLQAASVAASRHARQRFSVERMRKQLDYLYSW